MRSINGLLHHHGGGPPPYVGPLDEVPGAVVAYSQRAMSAAWTSNAITIRRDSDDTTMSFPTNVSNAVDMAAVVAFLNGANGFVVSLLDQSGNANNLGQATLPNQPGWFNSFLSVFPGLSFDGISQQLASLAAVDTSNSTITMFVVGQAAEGQSGAFAGQNWAESDPLGLLTSLTIAPSAVATQYSFVSELLGPDPYPGPEWESNAGIQNGDCRLPFILDFAVSPSAASVYLSGVLNTEIVNFGGSTAAGGTAQPLVVGGLDPAGGSQFNGKIVEVLLYTTVKSDSDRLAIRQNIASYYGLTLP